MDKLIKLPRFSYTEMDFDTIIQDVQNSIEEHPEYLENWNDFLETNAGRMLLELNAFISEKIAAKADWYAKEMFISTATRKESVINILKLINYRPPLPRTAKVSVNMKLTKWTPPFTLRNLEKIDALDKNGKKTVFECIEMAEDGKPDYNYSHFIDTGTENNKIYTIKGIPFYQGRTIVENDIFTDGVNNERYALSNSNVIENTIRIKSLTTGMEFIEIESFISPEAQQNDVDPSLRTIPYRVELNYNTVNIIFGHENLVKIPKKGERLEITYRVGGGTVTNIVAGSINSTKTYKLDGDRITVIFSNPTSAVGGNDTENIDEAKLIAPLKLRTANKTVTNEDYIITIENHPNILHSQIISKENEPREIFEEYGNFLPPLDVWIYICPEREGLEEANPFQYNELFKLSKTYNENKIIDFEDVDLYPSKQTVLLKKYKKYMWTTLYVTVYDENFTDDWLTADSFIEGEDYNIDEVLSEFKRIQSVDGGSIPAPDNEADPLTLRILYTNADSVEDHKNKTIKTVYHDSSTNKYTINLVDNPNNKIYPNYKIKVYDKKMEVEYQVDSDYIVDYSTGKIELIDNTNIDSDETVLVYYADNWDPEKICDERYYLDFIKNKKMLCVDNHIKDAEYSTYDIAITIYTYKSMTSDVKNNIKEHIRNRYNISQQTFHENISKSEITSHIMNYPGVRLAEITYLGRDYNLYQNYLLDNITLNELKEMKAENVEHKIISKYNEILVPSKDEWSGLDVLENQKHGLIITFKEM